jgi:hypothetical protein
MLDYTAIRHSVSCAGKTFVSKQYCILYTLDNISKSITFCWIPPILTMSGKVKPLQACSMEMVNRREEMCGRTLTDNVIKKYVSECTVQ